MVWEETKRVCKKNILRFIILCTHVLYIWCLRWSTFDCWCIYFYAREIFSWCIARITMKEKYVKFYMRFHKALQNKKSNSLLELNQSLLNKKFFLVGQKKLKTFKNKTYTKVLKTFRIMWWKIYYQNMVNIFGICHLL